MAQVKQEEISQEFIDGLSDRQLKSFRKEYPEWLSTIEALDIIQAAVEGYLEDSLGGGRNIEYIDEIYDIERSWKVILHQIGRLNIRIKNERKALPPIS